MSVKYFSFTAASPQQHAPRCGISRVIPVELFADVCRYIDLLSASEASAAAAAVVLLKGQ